MSQDRPNNESHLFRNLSIFFILLQLDAALTAVLKQHDRNMAIVPGSVMGLVGLCLIFSPEEKDNCLTSCKVGGALFSLAGASLAGFFLPKEISSGSKEMPTASLFFITAGISAALLILAMIAPKIKEKISGWNNTTSDGNSNSGGFFDAGAHYGSFASATSQDGSENPGNGV